MPKPDTLLDEDIQHEGGDPNFDPSMFDRERGPQISEKKEEKSDTDDKDEKVEKGKDKDEKDAQNSEEDEVYLDDLNRDDLLQYIEDEELDIDTDGMKDDELREAIEKYDPDKEKDTSKKDTEDKEEKETPEETIKRLLNTVNTLSANQSVATVESGNLKIEDQNFVTKEEFEDIQSADSPEKLNATLNKVFKKAIETATSVNAQDLEQRVSSKISAIRIAESFYAKNADLQDVQNYVSRVAQEMLQKDENKDLTLAELLDKAGKATRKAFGLPDPASKKGGDEDISTAHSRSKRVPAPRGGRSKRRVVRQRTKQSETAEGIEELVNHNKAMRF